LASQKRWACNALDDDKTLVEGLWTLGSHEKYTKLYKARVDWILDKIEGIVPEDVQRIQGPSLQAQRDGSRVRARGLDKDEERKKAAKRRQELIMQQMRAQQESFVSTFADVDSDDDNHTEDDGAVTLWVFFKYTLLPKGIYFKKHNYLKTMHFKIITFLKINLHLNYL